MDKVWPIIQHLRNYLNEKPNPNTGTECEEVDITKASFIMFVVIIMCATSWGSLIKRKASSGRRDKNQDWLQQPPPATN